MSDDENFILNPRTLENIEGILDTLRPGYAYEHETPSLDEHNALVGYYQGRSESGFVYWAIGGARGKETVEEGFSSSYVVHIHKNKIGGRH